MKLNRSSTIYFPTDPPPANRPPDPIALPPVSPARRRTIRRWAACNTLIQVGALLIVSQWWTPLTVIAAAVIWLLADLIIVAAMQSAR